MPSSDRSDIKEILSELREEVRSLNRTMQSFTERIVKLETQRDSNHVGLLRLEVAMRDLEGEVHKLKEQVTRNSTLLGAAGGVAGVVSVVVIVVMRLLGI